MTDKTDSKEREALVAYLKDCDAHDIVPDVGGAWHAAFQAGRASLAASAGREPVAQPTEDVRKKIQSNTWDHFGAILPTLKAISRGDWYWGANSRCKYIEIRLDTRDGGCILYDRERVRISPEQFAHQSHPVRMEPWPAYSGIANPSPPEGMVGGWTKASQQLPPCGDGQLFIGVNSAGFACVFNEITSNIVGAVHCLYETAEECIDVMSGLDLWRPFTPPTSSADSRKGE